MESKWLHPGNRYCAFAGIFQSVKAIVRAGSIPEDMRATLKGWLKSNDVLLVLLSLTVVHTISLNASAALRSSFAGERWMPRLEKVLQKPQSTAVGRALAQVLLDWAYLFRSEEIGQRSHAALAAHPKYRHMLDTLSASHAGSNGAGGGGGPSPEAVAVGEEVALGMPPVGPRKPPDLVALCLEDGKASSTRTSGSGVAKASSGSLPHTPPDPGALVTLLPGDDVPLSGLAILTASVDSTVDAIRSNAAQLEGHIATTRECLRQAGSQASVSCLLNAGYIAAQRCHICRGWVQKLAQTMQDEVAVSQLLTAIDAINSALAAWQALTSSQVYQALGITVPPLGSAKAGAGSGSWGVRGSAGASARAGNPQPARERGTPRADSNGPFASFSSASAAAAEQGGADLLGLNELLGDLAGSPEPNAAAASLSGTAGNDPVTWKLLPRGLPNGGGGVGTAAAALPSRASAAAGTARGASGPGAAPRLGRQSSPSGPPISAAAASQPAAPPSPVQNPFEGMDSTLIRLSSPNPFDDLLTPGPALSFTSDTPAVPPSQLTRSSPDARTGSQSVDSGASAAALGGGAYLGASEQPQRAVAATANAAGLLISGPRPQTNGPAAVVWRPPKQQLQLLLQQQQQQQPLKNWESFNSSSSEPSSPQRRHASGASLQYEQRHTGGSVASASHQQHRQQQQQQQQQQQGLASDAVRQLEGHAARLGISTAQQGTWSVDGGTAAMSPPHAPAVALASAGSSATAAEFDATCSRLLRQHGACSACHAPAAGLPEMVAQLQRLVAGMQTEHEAAVQALAKAHQAEVKAIKAASVQKFKELMGQQQQQQQQHPPPPPLPPQPQQQQQQQPEQHQVYRPMAALQHALPQAPPLAPPQPHVQQQDRLLVPSCGEGLPAYCPYPGLHAKPVQAGLFGQPVHDWPAHPAMYVQQPPGPRASDSLL